MSSIWEVGKINPHVIWEDHIIWEIKIEHKILSNILRGSLFTHMTRFWVGYLIMSLETGRNLYKSFISFHVKIPIHRKCHNPKTKKKRWHGIWARCLTYQTKYSPDIVIIYFWIFIRSEPSGSQCTEECYTNPQFSYLSTFYLPKTGRRVIRYWAEHFY